MPTKFLVLGGGGGVGFFLKGGWKCQNFLFMGAGIFLILGMKSESRTPPKIQSAERLPRVCPRESTS